MKRGVDMTDLDIMASITEIKLCWDYLYGKGECELDVFVEYHLFDKSMKMQLDEHDNMKILSDGNYVIEKSIVVEIYLKKTIIFQNNVKNSDEFRQWVDGIILGLDKKLVKKYFKKYLKQIFKGKIII